MDKNNRKCMSIREFFDFMIESGKLIEGQKIYDEKTRTKFINGRVTVDGKKVVGNLDWSRIRAHQFTFINDSEKLVPEYAKLPVTSDGISGDLPQPKNITEYLTKNAFGHYHITDDKIVVDKNLIIPKMEDMDLSKLEVQGNILWRGGSIRFDQLPKVSGQIYGMKKEDILSDKKLSSIDLKKKHIKPSVFIEEKPKSRIKELFNRCFNCA